MAASLAGRRFNNILLIGSIGIGNLLMFRPAMVRLRARYPDTRITLLVLKDFFADLFINDPVVDEVLPVDFKKHRSIGKVLGLFRRLRARNFDCVLTAFPANRTEYNLLARMTGAPVRIAHSYPTKKIRSLGWLQNRRVPLELDIHDVDQNLNLLRVFGETVEHGSMAMDMPLTGDEIRWGEEYLAGNGGATGQVIGIHPGSSEEHRMIYKRWAPEKFAELIGMIRTGRDVRILLFGGPGELPQQEHIRQLCGGTPEIVSGLTIRQAAAVIRCCRLFITNDSGLMHVAVCQQVPTAAVFGPTDHIRTAPYGPAHRVIRTGLDCSPCWKLREVGSRRDCIYATRRCMEELTAETVYREISAMLDS